MKRTSILRKTPIRRVNRRRTAQRRESAFGEQAQRCRESICVVCLVEGEKQQSRSDPSHHKSRAAGGGDDQCIPLCRLHHQELHHRGVVSFWSRYSIDPLYWLGRMQEGAIITEMEDVPA